MKTIHIIAAVLFVGNIIITGWWKLMANRTHNPVIITFAQRQVTLTDFIFTAQTTISAEYWQRERLWFIFGNPATILPLISIVLMVLKPS